MEARSWIEADESAKEMLSRTLAQRPFLLLPPLHRVPLRVGNVVEIVGPSASAKSEILLQAAVDCILPKEWNGIHFGGLERLVMYFDLDCRFDVLRLSGVLRYRLKEGRGFTQAGMQVGSRERDGTMSLAAQDDDELFLACMRRFLYIRCFSSYQFLAALKTMHHQIQKEREAQGVGVHFIMIDSINAFYWTDRTSLPPQPMGCNRRNFSLQCITESIVLEINKLLKVEPVLVLATKATILGFEPTRNEAQRTSGKWSSEDTSYLRSSSSSTGKETYREFMPSAWQSFVTHRILLRVSDENFDDMENTVFPIFTSQWLVPRLKNVDKFTVRDVGLSVSFSLTLIQMHVFLQLFYFKLSNTDLFSSYFFTLYSYFLTKFAHVVQQIGISMR